MMKPLLILSLLLAVPATAEKIKPPDDQELIEMRETVKELEGLLAEHQERLAVHKEEIDALRNRLATLEGPLSLTNGSR